MIVYIVGEWYDTIDEHGIMHSAFKQADDTEFTIQSEAIARSRELHDLADGLSNGIYYGVVLKAIMVAVPKEKS